MPLDTVCPDVITEFVFCTYNFSGDLSFDFKDLLRLRFFSCTSLIVGIFLPRFPGVFVFFSFMALMELNEEYWVLLFLNPGTMSMLVTGTMNLLICSLFLSY